MKELCSNSDHFITALNAISSINVNFAWYQKCEKNLKNCVETGCPNCTMIYNIITLLKSGKLESVIYNKTALVSTEITI